EEYRIVRPDGSVRWMRDIASVTWNEDGRSARLDGVVADVTERRLAEEALRGSEEKYRLIVDNIHEIIYQISVEKNGQLGAARFISGQVEALLGYRPEEFAAEPELWLTLAHPDDAPLLQATTEQVVQSREAAVREYRLRDRRSGEYRWMEDKAIPPHDSRIAPAVGVLGIDCHRYPDRRRRSPAPRPQAPPVCPP